MNNACNCSEPGGFEHARNCAVFTVASPSPVEVVGNELDALQKRLEVLRSEGTAEERITASAIAVLLTKAQRIAGWHIKEERLAAENAFSKVDEE